MKKKENVCKCFFYINYIFGVNMLGCIIKIYFFINLVLLNDF